MSWINSWRKRQKITIDHTKIDEDLQNFPVKVILPSDSSIFDYAKDDGADIRFTANDGVTLLDFEREVHNKTEKIAVYHVKIPSISSTSDTDFYIYYDNPIAEDASNPNAVWDENYELVMHMTPDLKDSTSNGNDGTNYGATINLANDGYYANFDGSSYIQLDNSVDFHLTNKISIDVYQKCILANKGRLINRHEPGNFGYMLARYTNNNIEFRISTTGSDWEGGGTSENSYPVNEDIYISATYNGNTMNVYIDGMEDTGGAFPYPLSGNINPVTHYFFIGKGMEDSDFFYGDIFEVRISSIARSDAWIKATSESLHNTLLTLGETETSNKTRMQVVFI